MDFERIFPFIVLYFIWRIFFKKQKKKPKIEKPKVSSDKTDKSISPADVLKQMLFGGIDMPQTVTPKRSDQEFYDESIQYTPEEYIAEDQEVIIPEDDMIVTPAPYFSKDVVEGKMKPDKSQSVRYAFRRQAYSRKDLQKAVIWSEILAPPLGLRDQKKY